MTEARWWEDAGDGRVVCRLCPHECRIAPGKTGICSGRENVDGRLMSRIYGRVTSASLDPMEKKPLYHFLPGTGVLSIGSIGCNFRCPFCQNWSISQVAAETSELLPAAAVGLALRKRAAGIAYTYNEPMIWLEYVIDTARLAREKGLANVMVTNGFVNPEPLAEALPHIDAMNIDVKSVEEDFYHDLCGGHLAPVLAAAEQAKQAGVHVEITYLIIPGYNDRSALYEGLATWMAEKLGPETPLHFSAHFPRYKLKAPETSVSALLAAREAAGKHLKYIYLGNVNVSRAADAACSSCDATLVTRSGYDADPSGLDPQGRCVACGTATSIVVRPRWQQKG